MNDDAIGLLTRALARLKKGWCQHALEDSDGNVCALGALNYAATGNANVWDPITVDSGAVSALDPTGSVFASAKVMRFNNAPETTQADVIDLFTRAINTEAVKTTADPAHTYTVAA
jgi:hypothetical protein